MVIVSLLLNCWSSYWRTQEVLLPGSGHGYRHKMCPCLCKYPLQVLAVWSERHHWCACPGFCPGTGTLTMSLFFRQALKKLLKNMPGVWCHYPYNLRFMSECHPKTVTFLDLFNELGDDHTVKTRLYRKPTTINTTTAINSTWHPETLVHNIPTGQYLRVHWNSTAQADFEWETQNLRGRFLKSR